MHDKDALHEPRRCHAHGPLCNNSVGSQVKSLNYIKQLGLKDNLRLKRGFSMETLCPHEYDIPLVRGGHLEGPHVFGFLICAFVSEL